MIEEKGPLPLDLVFSLTCSLVIALALALFHTGSRSHFYTLVLAFALSHIRSCTRALLHSFLHFPSPALALALRLALTPALAFAHTLPLLSWKKPTPILWRAISQLFFIRFWNQRNFCKQDHGAFYQFRQFRPFRNNKNFMKPHNEISDNLAWRKKQLGLSD